MDSPAAQWCIRVEAPAAVRWLPTEHRVWSRPVAEPPRPRSLSLFLQRPRISIRVRQKQRGEKLHLAHALGHVDVVQGAGAQPKTLGDLPGRHVGKTVGIVDSP